MHQSSNSVLLNKESLSLWVEELRTMDEFAMLCQPFWVNLPEAENLS